MIILRAIVTGMCILAAIGLILQIIDMIRAAWRARAEKQARKWKTLAALQNGTISLEQAKRMPPIVLHVQPMLVAAPKNQTWLLCRRTTGEYTLAALCRDRLGIIDTYNQYFETTSWGNLCNMLEIASETGELPTHAWQPHEMPPWPLNGPGNGRK